MLTWRHSYHAYPSWNWKYESLSNGRTLIEVCTAVLYGLHFRHDDVQEVQEGAMNLRNSTKVKYIQTSALETPWCRQKGWNVTFSKTLNDSTGIQRSGKHEHRFKIRHRIACAQFFAKCSDQYHASKCYHFLYRRVKPPGTFHLKAESIEWFRKDVYIETP